MGMSKRSRMEEQAESNVQTDAEKKAQEKAAEDLKQWRERNQDIEERKKRAIFDPDGEWVLLRPLNKKDEEDPDDSLKLETPKIKQLIPDGIYIYKSKKNPEETKPFRIKVHEGEMTTVPAGLGSRKERAEALAQLFAEKMGPDMHGAYIKYPPLGDKNGPYYDYEVKKFIKEVDAMIKACTDAGVPVYLDKLYESGHTGISHMDHIKDHKVLERWEELARNSRVNQHPRFYIADRQHEMAEIRKGLKENIQKTDGTDAKIKIDPVDAHIAQLKASGVPEAMHGEKLRENIDTLLAQIEQEAKELENQGATLDMIVNKTLPANYEKIMGMENVINATTIVDNTRDEELETVRAVEEAYNDLETKTNILKGKTEALRNKFQVINQEFPPADANADAAQMDKITALDDRVERLQNKNKELTTTPTEGKKTIREVEAQIAGTLLDIKNATPMIDAENKTIGAALKAFQNTQPISEITTGMNPGMNPGTGP